MVQNAGGAVTLAVGMAKVFANLPGMKTLTSYWYHFVTMFEGLFILTLLETGTRVARFVFQEPVAQFSPGAAIGHKPNWALNVLMSVVVCFAWGFLLYIGNLDTLWKMLGVANQLLPTIALTVGTTYLLRHAPKRIYALCTGIPLALVLVTVMTAGVRNVPAWFRSAAKVSGTEALLLMLAGGMGTLILALTVVIALDAIRRWWITLSSPAGPLPEPGRAPAAK